MKLAARQHKSLPEAMATNPSSHLLLWDAYFEWEERNDPLYFYLAQIALEVARANQGYDVSYRRSLKLADKLIPERVKAVAAPVGVTVTPQQSKAIWLAWAGIDPSTVK